MAFGFFKLLEVLDVLCLLDLILLTFVSGRLPLQAAAALCVGVGSFSDPDDLPGLAHFLEHSELNKAEHYDQRLIVQGAGLLLKVWFCSGSGSVSSGLHGK